MHYISFVYILLCCQDWNKWERDYFDFVILCTGKLIRKKEIIVRYIVNAQWWLFIFSFSNKMKYNNKLYTIPINIMTAWFGDDKMFLMCDVQICSWWITNFFLDYFGLKSFGLFNVFSSKSFEFFRFKTNVVFYLRCHQLHQFNLVENSMGGSFRWNRLMFFLFLWVNQYCHHLVMSGILDILCVISVVSYHKIFCPNHRH